MCCLGGDGGQLHAALQSGLHQTAALWKEHLRRMSLWGISGIAHKLPLVFRPHLQAANMQEAFLQHLRI